MELQIKKISNSEIPALIDCIKRIMQEEESHNSNSFSKDKWNWQYSESPYSNSQVFVISDGRSIYGYYHIALYEGIAAGQFQLFAMVQDVAISKELRGMGKFRELSNYANSFIDQNFPGIVFYTFPNDKSIHTFVKYNNYTIVDTLPSWFQPINSYDIVKSKFPIGGRFVSYLLNKFTTIKISRLGKNCEIEKTDVTPEFCCVFENYCSKQNLSLRRDINYIQWRFLKKPSNNHHFYSLLNNGEITAGLIVKIDTILGANCAVVMDFAHCDGHEKDLRDLIAHIGKFIQKKQQLNIAGVYISSSKNIKKLIGLDGFLKIPNFINPRPLNLLYKNEGSRNINFEGLKNWHITLSDWDVL
jgi:hypothetical protein